MSKPTRAQELINRASAIKVGESVYTPPEQFKDIKTGLDKALAALGTLNADEMPPSHQMHFKEAHEGMREAMDHAYAAHDKLNEVMGLAATTGTHPPKSGPVDPVDARQYNKKPGDQAD